MFTVAILRLIQDLKPKVKSSHWSLNGLAAHKFTNVSLLQALSVTHNYDFICLSEIFLDRLFQMKVKELILKVTIFCGRTIQVTKKEKVFVFNCTEHLPTFQRDDLCTLKSDSHLYFCLLQ